MDHEGSRIGLEATKTASDQRSPLIADRTLRWNGKSNIIALQLKSSLDASRKVEFCKQFIERPYLPLKIHRLIPPPRNTKVIEPHTLPGDYASRPRKPSIAPPSNMTLTPIWEDAAYMRSASPHLAWIDSKRPVFDEASFSPAMF